MRSASRNLGVLQLVLLWQGNTVEVALNRWAAVGIRRQGMGQERILLPERLRNDRSVLATSGR